MADAPKLFGKPGERNVTSATSTRAWIRWTWVSGEWTVTLTYDGAGSFDANVRLDGEDVWYCRSSKASTSMGYVEGYLTERAADLDAMGVPRV